MNRNPNFLLEQSTKQYTDDSIDVASLLRNNLEIDLNNDELPNIKSISVNLNPSDKINDFHNINLLPKSIINEFVTTNIDEQSLLRIHKDEKLLLAGKEFITLESSLTTPILF